MTQGRLSRRRMPPAPVVMLGVGADGSCPVDRLGRAVGLSDPPVRRVERHAESFFVALGDRVAASATRAWLRLRCDLLASNGRMADSRCLGAVTRA
jgi:hypothetical protein